MNERKLLALLPLVALAACSSPGHPAAHRPASASPSVSLSAAPAPPEPARRRVIAVDYGHVGSLDPVTLRPSEPGRVHLSDFPIGQVLSPDRLTIAFGSINDGTITTFDPGTFTPTRTLNVIHKHINAPRHLEPVSWPTNRLIVAVAQPGGAHVSLPGQLLLIDPDSGHVRRHLALHGMSIAEASAPDGTAVVLVGGVHDTGPGRIVIVDPRGRVRTVSLPAIKAGSHTEADSQWPGLVLHRRTAYVVGEGEAITTVALDSLRVTSHSVPGLMVERILPLGPPMEPGSGGVYRAIDRSVDWVGPHRVLINGSDSFPTDCATRNQWVSHPAMLVDTHAWRVTRTFQGAGQVEAVGDGRVFVEWLSSMRNGHELRRFAATSSGGRVLWRIRLRNAYPSVIGDRLVVSVGYRSRAEELDVRTGEIVRRLRRWDPDYVIFWSRKHGMRVSPDLG